MPICWKATSSSDDDSDPDVEPEHISPDEIRAGVGYPKHPTIYNLNVDSNDEDLNDVYDDNEDEYEESDVSTSFEYKLPQKQNDSTLNAKQKLNIYGFPETDSQPDPTTAIKVSGNNNITIDHVDEYNKVQLGKSVSDKFKSMFQTHELENQQENSDVMNNQRPVKEDSAIQKKGSTQKYNIHKAFLPIIPKNIPLLQNDQFDSKKIDITDDIQSSPKFDNPLKERNTNLPTPSPPPKSYANAPPLSSLSSSSTVSSVCMVNKRSAPVLKTQGEEKKDPELQEQRSASMEYPMEAVHNNKDIETSEPQGSALKSYSSSVYESEEIKVETKQAVFNNETEVREKQPEDDFIEYDKIITLLESISESDQNLLEFMRESEAKEHMVYVDQIKSLNDKIQEQDKKFKEIESINHQLNESNKSLKNTNKILSLKLKFYSKANRRQRFNFDKIIKDKNDSISLRNEARNQNQQTILTNTAIQFKKMKIGNDLLKQWIVDIYDGIEDVFKFYQEPWPSGNTRDKIEKMLNEPPCKRQFIKSSRQLKMTICKYVAGGEVERREYNKNNTS